jgi:hypothetical protein
VNKLGGAAPSEREREREREREMAPLVVSIFGKVTAVAVH